MESPDSDTSSDESSPADSTSADSSPTQAQPSIGETQITPAMEDTSVIHNDDSASDVSMSTDSEDEDDDDPNTGSISTTTPIIQGVTQAATLNAVEPNTEPSKKRKYLGLTETPNGELQNATFHEIRKRIKPDDSLQSHWTPEGRLRKNKSLLPPEIWHHIFTFCPPRVLGLLLQVNRTFNAYLDTSSGHSHEPLSRSVLQILTPETIWRASRHLHLQGTPVPLAGKTELDMWKLACGTSCQFCGKKRQTNSAVPMDQWHPGPGENGVIPIWSFGIRACGSCVQTRSTKEIDLLLSSSIPSPLMTALPFMFLTNELHVIPAATLQSGPPTGIQISKHFFKPHIEELKQEFDDVKAMGSAAAEEWIKGLEGRGRERRNDAVRWERWEAGGGVARMRNLETNVIRNPERQSSTHTLHSSSSTPVATTNGHTLLYQGHNSAQPPKPFQSTQSAHPPLPVHSTLKNGPAPNPPPRFDSPSQNGFSSYPPRPRHERTKEEVAELKAARRAEIERRCMLLNPPITAGVLAHMASFQAAIQIIQPLDDGAWEVLKPRLLSQREEAEQRENDRIAQTRVVQERFDERRFQDMQVKSDSKDLVDREWDDIQAPLRARIGGYADEIIRDGWNNGEKVSHETAPLFASEVLIYVRKRFYAEVAKDEAAVRATGREPELDPPNGPYTRKLILENMKWVFDTKVKPHTEPYRKELFLCNACEYPSKYYGFEGVIQHYAAKHTSALSVGSVVVHWKSEWPEYPPFHPDPNNASVAPYYAAAPNSSVPYAGAGPSTQQNYGYGGYQPAPVSAPMSTPNPHVYQESPGPYYGHPQFGEQYSGHQNGPYPPPPTYPDNSQGYQTPQYSAAPPPAPVQGYNDLSQDYSQQGFGGQYQPMAQNMYTSPHPSTLYPATVAEVPAQQPTYPPPVAQYGQPYNQQPAYMPNSFTQGPSPPQRTEEYMAQLQDIARNAREVWNSIGNLKDVPGALKVYTIIYHLLQRFRTTFQEDPPLAMIVDGLSNNKDMRPVRNINGLLCKACSLGMAGSSSAPQKKRFSFPQLVNHFHSVHEQGITLDNHDHIPEWTKDMVELPDMSDLRLTSASPGMDENKFRLFTEAIPELFAVPTPNMGSIHNGSSQHYENIADRNEFQGLAPSLDNHEKYYTTVDSGRPSETGSVTYDSGEYDPRHPGDLPVEPRQQYKAPRRSHNARQHQRCETDQPSYRYELQGEEPPQGAYDDMPSRSYIEQRPISQPSRALPLGDYERVLVRDETPVYMDRPVRYRDSGEIEYRIKREPRALVYDEPDPVPVPRDYYRLANSQAYESNRHEIPSVIPREPHPRSERLPPAEDAAAQQNRISEVVAQISQQAQQARQRQPIQEEPVEAGSEDGEVRADPTSKPENGRTGPSDEASDAAERFLNEFLPGETADDAAQKREIAERRREDELRTGWEEAEREERQVYQAPAEPLRRIRDGYDDDHRIFPSSGRLINPGVEEVGHNGYIIRERISAPRQSRAYAYEERYISGIPEQALPRERSPELVDRRYKLNNVIYRDERQGSHGTRRTPSRYARYESVRLENDRARSRSPVYVKMGAQPAQYRERSPAAPALRQEPIYRTRTPPPAAEELAYERAPRQEYYRVYADEPRPREPQYAEAFEYVRVSDPQGDYMIRRPVRREPEPVYATYEDEVYTRQPVYESRAAASRPEAPIYEEYDPRHPEPPLQAPVRQVRYQ